MHNTKNFWNFALVFVVAYVVVDWVYESVAEGLFWKGFLALILAVVVYGLVIKKV